MKDKAKVSMPSIILLIIPTLLLLVIGMSGEEGPVGTGSVLNAFLTSEITELVTELRFRGSILLGMVIFSFAILFNSFRNGERWAWYVMWYWPIFFALHIYSFRAWIPDLPLLVLSSLALVLSYRKVFNKKDMTKEETVKG